MKIGFDIISDLYLDPNESFNWENKATSLFCILAGNVSSDMRTISQTLLHLSRFYKNIFYIPGPLEYINTELVDNRTIELIDISNSIQGVTLLYSNVVVVDGVAIVGINGWDSKDNFELITESDLEVSRAEDLYYLNTTIKKLQKHLDVRRILVVSNSVPNSKLYFGENQPAGWPLDGVLTTDTQKKIKHWVFGTYEKIVDTTSNGINYLNNPYCKRKPYWAKRLEIET